MPAKAWIPADFAFFGLSAITARDFGRAALFMARQGRELGHV
jgi:hypothetical protein